jgi:hypothetical protein
VYVAVRRNDTLTWLQADGSYGPFTWVRATLDQPGAPSSTWSFSHTLPAAGGYFMQLRVDDAAHNQNPLPRPKVAFTATAGSRTLSGGGEGPR